MTQGEVLFKVLGSDGHPIYGTGRWSLPQDGRPGDWMPPIEGDLIPCENGYHLCKPEHLVKWLGPCIFLAEGRGDRIDCDDKVVFREARLLKEVGAWNERTARLFACDCAERVVHLCGDDPRPREAIEVARRFANDEATEEELTVAWAAASDAAWAAASDAARAAARAAVHEWQTQHLMQMLGLG